MINYEDDVRQLVAEAAKVNDTYAAPVELAQAAVLFLANHGVGAMARPTELSPEAQQAITHLYIQATRAGLGAFGGEVDLDSPRQPHVMRLRRAAFRVMFNRGFAPLKGFAVIEFAAEVDAEVARRVTDAVLTALVNAEFQDDWRLAAAKAARANLPTDLHGRAAPLLGQMMESA